MATKKKTSKATSSQAVTGKTSSGTKKQPVATAANGFATKLPDLVQKNEYVRRTVDILDDTKRQAGRLSKRTGRKLSVVALDLREEISSSIEGRVDNLVKKTKLDRFKKTWDKVYDSTIKTVDDCLSYVGLVRKAAL